MDPEELSWILIFCSVERERGEMGTPTQYGEHILGLSITFEFIIKPLRESFFGR